MDRYYCVQGLKLSRYKFFSNLAVGLMHQKGMYRNVLSNTVCNSPKLGITLMSTDSRWIYKLRVFTPWNTIYQ